MPRTSPPYPPEPARGGSLLRSGAHAPAAGGGTRLFRADAQELAPQDEADRGERVDVLSSDVFGDYYPVR